MKTMKKGQLSGQLSKAGQENMIRQHYKLVGSHSAVKTCGWTRSVLRGRGGCYKLKFYGIRSHQCMQMTTSISCANRCTFCWRDYKAPVSKTWDWKMDDPDFILEESRKAHNSLLIGFRGNDQSPKNILEEAQTVRHVALSLTGEPITYPKINELIRKFHGERISTFLVTNAQYPDEIRKLEPVTQLYLSIDAPDKDILREVDRPLFSDYWERMQASLDAMAEKEGRTCIRLTIIKGINDVKPEKYAELIGRGNPDFVEVKAYMFIGASMERLEKKNMPDHQEVKDFAERILPHLSDYEFVSEHVPSRVVLLAKKSYRKKTWIDFDGFFRAFDRRMDNKTGKGPSSAPQEKEKRVKKKVNVSS
ncbi:MAG: 4-demethylwyosine synthase TYW1 [DPANN group archaeon]|nr:4-demethylwyosine synthase TYW1 [DPANN group archaeon]